MSHTHHKTYSRRVYANALAALGLLALASAGHGQALYLDPPRFHINSRPFSGPEIHTLHVVADFGIQNAVAWGTTITLADTQTLEFVNYADTGKPFRSAQPFFNDDSFSDYLDADISDGDASIKLLFLNLDTSGAPSGTLGLAGEVALGEFQVRVKREPNYPEQSNFGGQITLASMDFPPLGTGVLDENGNNLLTRVEAGAQITSRPPTPEPSTAMTLLCGSLFSLLALRRRSRQRA